MIRKKKKKIKTFRVVVSVECRHRNYLKARFDSVNYKGLYENKNNVHKFRF